MDGKLCATPAATHKNAARKILSSSTAIDEHRKLDAIFILDNNRSQ